MQNISPCLWFDNQAEEAAKFYTGIFKNSKILDVARYTKAADQARLARNALAKAVVR